MEVKHFKACPECRGRGGITRPVPPDPVSLRRPGMDPVPEPGDFTTYWEPCAKCDGTGTVALWKWVGL